MSLDGGIDQEPWIILDTNFLIYCVRNRIDVIRTLKESVPEAKPAIPESVVSELKGLSGKNPDAAVSLNLIRDFRTVHTSSPGDRGILEAAILLNRPVVTNDRILSSLLKSHGIKVYYLRDRRYLEVRH